jgi:endonuclease/exonuclease/phosphatase (EEP) superfamily protein YafD
MLAVLKFVIWLAALGVLTVTFLPLLNTHLWWIRMWDFPRLHIFIVAIILAVAAFFVFRPHSPAILLIIAISATYQAHILYPFTPLARVEIELKNISDRPTISLLAANVLMENEQHDLLIALIAEENPDVLFLMETNAKWAEALEDTLSQYATVLRHPLENHFGLIFASNIDVESVETVFLADDRTPTLLAELRTPDGAGFHFIGMHPRPPVPGNDTEERDAQLKRAATLTRDSNLPVIVMGDFNDVAWSWTARRYKHHGNFLDPRVGRGMLSSFDANHPILRFPIDQLYLTRGFDLVSFERKRNIGSDHFPMGAIVSLQGRGNT